MWPPPEPDCRLVTGRDWARLGLQQLYGDHWVPALLSRIHRLG